MAAKCNITRLVLNKLYKIIWGISCEDSRSAILENYIEYLDCPDIDLVICNPDNCKNDPISFNCSFTIRKITLNQLTDEVYPTLTFLVVPADLINGIPLYTYQWTYNNIIFDLIGGDQNSSIVLKVKTGIDINTLVTAIGVTIIDGNECRATKVCYLTPAGMVCRDNFVPCPNSELLVSVFNPLLCARADNLVVEIT